MQLRYYQQEAVSSAYQYLSDNPGKNPCIVLPTGAGKTLCIAKFCTDVLGWGGRGLVLAHVKELLEQSAKKISECGVSDLGIYSAGLGKRETSQGVIVAGIQSVYERGFQLSGDKPFSLVIVDEAHRIPTDGDGMYRKLLKDLQIANPATRVVGLTAAPFRTSGGYVCSDTHFLNEVCYTADIRELIAGGFLCNLASKKGANEADLRQVKIKRGEFVQSEMEAAFLFDNKVSAAVNEIVAATAGRKKVIVFCCGIQHACEVTAMLDGLGQKVRLVTSEHGGRDKAIEDFKSDPNVKYLVNINCLTEGFDAPNIDAVVLLRATCSPGLYYQMVGRGLRTHPDKKDCLILDFGGNIARHGTIDNLRISSPKNWNSGNGEAPVKECSECGLMVHAALSVCPECSTAFPEREPNHEPQASADAPLSEIKINDWEVESTTYSLHTKKASGSKSMRVSYMDSMGVIAEEWVCIEHTGFAFAKAYAWWKARSTLPMPSSVEEAVELASMGKILEPIEIRVKRKTGDRFAEVIGYKLAKPVARVAATDEW